MLLNTSSTQGRGVLRREVGGVLALGRDAGRGAAKSRSATTLADRAASGRQVEGQVAAVLAPAVHVVVLAAETD